MKNDLRWSKKCQLWEPKALKTFIQIKKNIYEELMLNKT